MLTQLIVDRAQKQQTLGRVRVSAESAARSSPSSVCASKNSCALHSTIGRYLTASSDAARAENGGNLKKRKQKNERTNERHFSLALLFCSKITSRVSFITRGYVVYAVHDNDVKSAQKISRGCHRLCVCVCVRYRMNESSRLSITHVS